MGNLKPREKFLFIVTVLAIVGYAAWMFGLEEAFESITSGSSDVSSMEKRFEDDLEALEDLYVIERDFAKVGEFPKSDDENLRPALAFTQQVSQICADLGFDFPPIRPEVEEIEGVEDYELINVAIKTEGNFSDTVKLLKTFEQNGLIFRDVDLQSSRDREIITARITVARIAEVERRASLNRLSRRN